MTEFDRLDLVRVSLDRVSLLKMIYDYEHLTVWTDRASRKY